MRDFLAPSFGTAFGVAEVTSYQTLASRLSRSYCARLASVHPPSALLDWAGAALVVDLSPQALQVERGAIRLLSNPAAKPRVFPAEEGSAEVTLIDYRPGSVRAEVKAARPATIVFSETDYPGWRASVDGKPIAHERFEGIFPAVPVAQGTHVVSFRFVPLSFWIGLPISAGTLAAMLL